MTLELNEWWSDETQWNNDNRQTYSYDSKDNRTSKMYEYWGDEQWNNSSRSTYTNDSKGNVTFILNEEWDGSQWILTDDYFSFNDSFGNSFGFYGSKIVLFYSTLTDVVEGNLNITKFSLDQNYPNPFNPSTKIQYTIAKSPLLGGDGRSGLVTLKVYDILGREVATLVNKNKKPGYYEVHFNASSLTSGIYFYRLQSGNFIQTKKMILLR
ncbi:MAG: T9SS type A sorting domain-containing protein [Chlorobi bacterium]|nr:T9SS type A sorting domain-containing protein [Chlorobiota bacterium]